MTKIQTNQNQTNQMLLVDLPGLAIGEIITKFRVIGALGASVAGATVVDATLYKVTKGAGASAASAIDNITTVTVTADTALDAEETLGVAETIAADNQYFVLVDGVTFNDATNDIFINGVELDITP